MYYYVQSIHGILSKSPKQILLSRVLYMHFLEKHFLHCKESIFVLLPLYTSFELTDLKQRTKYKQVFMHNLA